MRASVFVMHTHGMSFLAGLPGGQMSQEEMMKSLADSMGAPKVTPGRVRRLSKKKPVTKGGSKGFGKAAQELASL